jgi:cysteine-S-conjugate beta-lyase
MTGPDLDLRIDRSSAEDCKKWRLYPGHILPMWVADMDFAVAEPITRAMRDRLDHPVFGYAQASDALKGAIVDWLASRHAWKVLPDDLVFLPGVEPGFNMALKAMLQPGDGVVVQTPVYRPILAAPGHWGLNRIDVPLTPADGGWSVDEARLEKAISQSRALLFCNPHNPTGKVFSEAELSFLAACCDRHDILIISDEIHCDLVYPGHRHRPIATLSPGIAARTVTLMSASKTFNIAGLKTAFAVITNPDLRRRFQEARSGMVDSVNLMGLEATRAALLHGEAWRQATVAYLEANRDHLTRELKRRCPDIGYRPPQASFLAWLDCTALGLAPDPHAFFLSRAHVGFSSGAEFGPGGEGHVRLNFGCTRATLDEALDRMERALTP